MNYQFCKNYVDFTGYKNYKKELYGFELVQNFILGPVQNDWKIILVPTKWIIFWVYSALTVTEQYAKDES